MSSASYVLVGTAGAMAHTFGSTCHGAGRALSRAKALKTLDSKAVLRRCEQAGVEVRIKTRRLAAEEVRVRALMILQLRCDAVLTWHARAGRGKLQGRV